ncbi:MAG: hypothetical protein IPJ77_07390 [Planctomycetes bacterium]|nr:hypothetical protein [Planctomycetota bacterium]
MNHVPDACDIAVGTSQDANGNSVPDECEAAAGAAFCFGDGSGAPCPCGNNSAPGLNAGCLNSSGTGAWLTATGQPRVSADSLVLHLQGTTPLTTSLYLQGTGQDNGGLGTAFGDGIRCVGGFIIRLRDEELNRRCFRPTELR